MSKRKEKNKNNLEPTMVRGLSAHSAWFYVNPKSIDVFIWEPGQKILSCRIPKKVIQSINFYAKSN